MKRMTWAQRICIGSQGWLWRPWSPVPAVAGATAPGCYTGCTPPNVQGTVVTPPASGSSGSVSTTASVANGSTSLPFTGADIGELAVVGVGAVAIGGLLARRRRSA